MSHPEAKDREPLFGLHTLVVHRASGERAIVTGIYAGEGVLREWWAPGDTFSGFYRVCYGFGKSDFPIAEATICLPEEYP